MEHPDQMPYLLNHSSKMSYPEKIFQAALEKAGIIGWVYNYRHSIYSYDFAFPDIKLDVEIDGGTHLQEKVKQIDRRRDKFSQEKGWTVLRFPAQDVKKHLDECIVRVQNILDSQI